MKKEQAIQTLTTAARIVVGAVFGIPTLAWGFYRLLLWFGAGADLAGGAAWYLGIALAFGGALLVSFYWEALTGGDGDG